MYVQTVNIAYSSRASSCSRRSLSRTAAPYSRVLALKASGNKQCVTNGYHGSFQHGWSPNLSKSICLSYCFLLLAVAHAQQPAVLCGPGPKRLRPLRLLQQHRAAVQIGNVQRGRQVTVEKRTTLWAKAHACEKVWDGASNGRHRIPLSSTASSPRASHERGMGVPTTWRA